MADEVGEADAVGSVTEQYKARGGLLEPDAEFGDAVGVADGILRKRVGPAADDSDGGRRRGPGRRGGDRHAGVEDAGEFEARDGRCLVIVAATDAIGGGPSEEGANETASGWDAMREFLVGEGAG
jgi:hypothetical protein